MSFENFFQSVLVTKHAKPADASDSGLYFLYFMKTQFHLLLLWQILFVIVCPRENWVLSPGKEFFTLENSWMTPVNISE